MSLRVPLLVPLALAPALLAACTSVSEESYPEPEPPPDKELFPPPAVDPATMVAISEGTYTRGHPPVTPLPPYNKDWKENEMPAHEVTLSAYSIDRDEVTVEEYAVFLSYAAGEKHYDPLMPITRDGSLDYRAVPGKEKQPIRYVSWAGADEYCRWRGKRLPTEAEWERAARGPDPYRKFPWGDTGPSCAVAVFYTGESYCHDEPQPVGGRSPGGDSPEGVRDMAGNVAEWTQDHYGPYSDEPLANPVGPESSADGRVVRGGGYRESGPAIRTSARWAGNPEKRSGGIGFRCAL